MPFHMSASHLKVLAMVSMLVDHIAVVFSRYLYIHLIGNLTAYTLMRGIGRIALPIFVFLLVEGFLHTKDIKKYILRMGIFTLLSEIPFDLAMFDMPFYWGYQSIMLSLLICLLMLCGMERYAKENMLWRLGIVLVAMGVARVLRVDYGYMCPLIVAVLYHMWDGKISRYIVGAVMFIWEWPALFAFIPLSRYSGKKGYLQKYIVYIFYPLHLLLLFFIRLWI